MKVRLIADVQIARLPQEQWHCTLWQLPGVRVDSRIIAWAEFENFRKTEVDTGKVTSGDVFGTREYLKNNYLYRMTAAVIGIYGNSKQEAMYPVYFVDSDHQKLDAANQRYTLRFVPGQLPPV